MPELVLDNSQAAKSCKVANAAFPSVTLAIIPPGNLRGQGVILCGSDIIWNSIQTPDAKH